MSVVITTYNHAHYLGASLASVAAQTHPVDEVIVVDDGSSDDPATVVADWPGTTLVRQDNRGLASARNAGLRTARSTYVLFLDADDLLTPVGVAAGLDCFARHPEAALVYGAHRRVDATGQSLGERRYSALGDAALPGLLRGNAIAMHATVMYRRKLLLEAGGFDETLRRCEDYDVYLRLASEHTFASHPVETALYRWHGANMSAHPSAMLDAVLRVHARYRPTASQDPELHRAWAEGRVVWRAYYAREVLESARSSGAFPLWAALSAARLSPALVARLAARAALRRVVRHLPRPARDAVGRAAPRLMVRPRGRVRMGDLDRVDPISLDFGWDRGTPIDRHYVEDFLRRMSADVAGRVLEIGDATYSRRFGGERVEVQDILHVHAGNPAATIVGDISQAGVLPESRFDCIVMTQTLHLVYDMQTAVAHLHAALRPGGVLLLTVPGISQIDRGEWGAQWFWALTPAAVQRLVGDVFGQELVSVESHGNVFAATTFLQGMVVEEIDVGKLAPRDTAYPVVVTARALKLTGRRTNG